MTSVFLSYAHHPGHGAPAVAVFRDRLEHALRAAAPHLEFDLHMDVRGLGRAAGRGDALADAATRGAVMVPLVTPAYLEDRRCRAEVSTFHRRVTAAGFLHRIVVVIWQRTPRLDEPGADDVARLLRLCPTIDYSEMRFEPADHPGQQGALARIAEAILGTLERQLDTLPPEGVDPPNRAEDERDAELAGLLLRMFTPRELRRMLLRMKDGESLAMAVDAAGPTTPEEFSEEVVVALRRFGRIDELFFHQLRRARPFRRAEIEALAQRYRDGA
ncbi:MAG: TIR domain-containing protein [Deltaproteobacteria bacterium]|nr:MAG: TIR domain-containing protein [Deltaproteobacteria bacterium]